MATQEFETEIEQDIFDTPVDHTQAKTEAKKLGLKAGMYRTEPVLMVTGKTHDDGRRVAAFFGTVTQNGVAVGKIGFRFSPDLRYKESDSGEEKADWNYQMYIKALRVFKETTGQDATSATELVQFIANYPIMLRISLLDSGDNMVSGFAKVRD